MLLNRGSQVGYSKLTVVACGLVVKDRGRDGSPKGGGREGCSQEEGG